MSSRAIALGCLLASGLTGITPSAAAQAPAAPPAAAAQAFKPTFKELQGLLGSWSGSSDQGGRIGGRVVTFSLEVDGVALAYRGTSFFPAKDDLPEMKLKDEGYVSFDIEKQKYVGVFFFSNGIWGLFDVEPAADGSVTFTSRELFNFEGKSRLVLKKTTAAEATLSHEVASGGGWAPYATSKLTKK